MLNEHEDGFLISVSLKGINLYIVNILSLVKKFIDVLWAVESEYR
jgi:hypothetical protein